MTETRAPRVVVLGSVHMDLIASAARLPAAGESVAGGTFAMAPGGKAGNQACQCALAGAETAIVTRLGDDTFGRQLLVSLAAKGVDTSLVSIDPTAPTGASTVLAAAGDYASIIAPGAAGLISAEDIGRARPRIETADALLLQLEVPAATSALAAAIAAEAGRVVVLNASPAPDSWETLPADLRRSVSVLVVNRVEAARLLGSSIPREGAEEGAAALAALTGAKTVAMTLGAEGIVAARGAERARQAAYPSPVVDAVGAGDAFLGTFVVTLLGGSSLADALRRGAAAGAIAVSRRGVYEALPSPDEVDAFLAGVH